MCFKPKIDIPEPATPAQAPPPLKDLPTPEAFKAGGQDEDSKTLGGKTGKAGKSGLKIKMSSSNSFGTSNK